MVLYAAQQVLGAAGEVKASSAQQKEFNLTSDLMPFDLIIKKNGNLPDAETGSP